MSDFSIRLARVDDAEALPAIEQAAAVLFRSVEGLAWIADMPPVPADRQRVLIRKGRSLVAESEGQIVGFLSGEPQGRELHIREVSVHPGYQNRGIGGVLLRACGIDARNGGFAALTLTTFVDVPWNEPFYRRHGFELVTDLGTHPRLAGEIADEAGHGLPRERRCAMIRFLR